jgi:hypothetical protein
MHGTCMFVTLIMILALILFNYVQLNYLCSNKKSHHYFVKCTEIEHKIWPLSMGFLFESSRAVVKPSWQSNVHKLCRLANLKTFHTNDSN